MDSTAKVILVPVLAKGNTKGCFCSVSRFQTSGVLNHRTYWEQIALPCPSTDLLTDSVIRVVFCCFIGESQ